METIQIESRGEVTTIRLHRPEVRNALNEVMIAELTQAFGALSSETRVVILAGAGASFCAGADAQWMKRSKSFSREENERDAAGLAALLTAVDECPRPVIAPVRGSALGAASAWWPPATSRSPRIRLSSAFPKCAWASFPPSSPRSCCRGSAFGPLDAISSRANALRPRRQRRWD